MRNEELDMKQSDWVEKFTSPARKMKKAARKWDVNGIDENHPNTYIARERLVAKAINSARQHRFLVVGSPPGTGKTSLAQLIQAQLAESNKTNTEGKIRGYYIRPSQVKDDFDLFDYVADRTGVDLRQFKVPNNLEGSPEIWLIFDDAQRLYDERHYEFWELVTKHKGQIEAEFRPIKIIVVVLATYHLSSTTTGSPACFKTENRLGCEDLLFQKEEAVKVYRCRCMRPDWNEYFERLFYLTQGAPAAFTIGMNRIVHLSEKVDIRNASQELTESDALFQLIENTPFAELERCFPSRKINEQSGRVILSAVVETYQANMGDNDDDDGAKADDKAIIMLIKAGILKESMQFSSPIAKRFYYNQVFPRAPRDSEVPETLDDLIVEATKKLSARRLKGARQTVSENPKEAVYQQLFHESFASLLPVSYRIIPELGTKAIIGGRTVGGELDFYIKNGKKWAVEFVRKSDRLNEHLNRIPGKYRNVEASSWLVVDCLMGGRPKKRDKDLCTLVFDNKFASCECYVRLMDPKTVTLHN